MDFSLSEDHSAIREGVSAIVRSFDDEYWLARDEDGEFPREFHRAMADAGWLGITMPTEYGGSGLGVTEACIMMHEVASHGGGEACVCDIASGVGVSQPTVSHHLKVLRDAGLLTSQRRASWVYYAVVPETLTALSALLDSAKPVETFA